MHTSLKQNRASDQAFSGFRKRAEPKKMYSRIMMNPELLSVLIKLRHAALKQLSIRPSNKLTRSIEDHFINLTKSKTTYERAVCIMSTYNDIDVIEGILKNTAAQELDLYIIDNWSSDGTWEEIQRLKALGNNIVGIERFPSDKANATYDWHSILTRKAEVASTFPARWILHQDSDEVTISPVADISLSRVLDGIYRKGYNAVSLRMLDFRPMNDLFTHGDPVQWFTHFEFSNLAGYDRQTKIWFQRSTVAVDLASEGGHDVRFKVRNVYPIRLPRLHYSIRSLNQLRQKVEDRLRRANPEELKIGWHAHLRELQDKKIIYSANELIQFKLETVIRDHKNWFAYQ